MADSLQNAFLPDGEPIAEFTDERTKKRVGARITANWLRFFATLINVVNQAPNRLDVVALADQAANIGATDLSGGQAIAGAYRLSYYARVTQAATVNSSLTVTLGWTEGGVARSISGTPMTANTTGTLQQGSVFVVADDASPLTFSTTYASTGATPMQYGITVSLDQVAV